MDLDLDSCLKQNKLKLFSRGPALARKELDLAAFDLTRALESFKDDDYKWSTVQAYYSMFHSARALLYRKGYREKSHYCLIVAIRNYYVVKNQLDFKVVEDFQKGKNLRESADYGGQFSKASAAQLQRSAKKFLAIAQEIIKKD